MGKFDQSNHLLEEAKALTPIGAQTYSKSYRYFCEGNSPAFIEKGEGCYLEDIDGNRFIDFICALGPITLGYNDAGVNNAIIEQLNKGIVFSQPSPISIELAKKIVEIIPCAEMVRFVKNGSDATSAAIRLARAYTDREMVLVSGYHGMQDWYIGSTSNNKGIPKAVCALTKSFPYNDIEAVKELLKTYKNQVAAIILEPIQGDGPNEDYLSELKTLAHEQGVVLIFDEVVSGFRYALGGAQELYDVTPDMVAFGKGMANGMPLSVVAGKKEIMELIGTKGVFISTTFGGETLSMAAALETINRLEQPGVYDGIWDLGNRMLKGMKTLINQYALEKVVKPYGLAPHCGVTFEGVGSLDYIDVSSIYQQRMIKEGILTVGINNINLSHDGTHIDAFLSAVDLAFADISSAIKQDSLKDVLVGGKIDPIFKRNI